jgi:chromosomal replication initiator protein
MTKNFITVWEDCLSTLRHYISTDALKTWFAPIKPIKLENDVLTIALPSMYYYEWIEQHYIDYLRLAMQKSIGEKAGLEYSIVVDNGNANTGAETMQLPNQQTTAPVPLKPADNSVKALQDKQAKVKEMKIYSNLLSQYTFDNFVEGESNRFALATAQSVAMKPGRVFNPLYIYGGYGLGKTHLAHAVGNAINAAYPEARIAYINGESFVAQFVEAIKTNKAADFAAYYMNVDVFILDDVERLSGKEKTQENLFHIFNELQTKGKQIVIVSDTPAKDMQGFQGRMLSRFSWGIQVSISLPDYEFKKKLIIAKTKAEGIVLANEIVETIAKEPFTCIRNIEGVIATVLARYSLMKQEITVEMVQEIMQQFITSNKKEISITSIQEAIIDYFKVTIDELKSKARTKKIAQARQIAMYLCKEYTCQSTKIIGDSFGKRDHSTVVHAAKAIEKKKVSDVATKTALQEIAAILRVAL